MDKLTPIANNIVVKLDKAKEEVKSSGVIVPITAQAPPLHGTVISVGYNTRNGQKVPITSVAPGDRILIGMYSGVEFNYNDIEYRYMKESEIIGIITDNGISNETLLLMDLLNNYSDFIGDETKELLQTLISFNKTPYEYLDNTNKGN